MDYVKSREFDPVNYMKTDSCRALYLSETLKFDNADHIWDGISCVARSMGDESAVQAFADNKVIGKGLTELQAQHKHIESLGFRVIEGGNKKGDWVVVNKKK